MKRFIGIISGILILLNTFPGRIVSIAHASLPQLTTDGPLIKRTDTGETVQLKGVTTDAFRFPYYPDAEPLLSHLNTVKPWGINLLGLNMDNLEDIKKDKLDVLDAVIDWAEKNNTYVYIMPVNAYDSVYDKTVEDFLSFAAKRY